MSTHAPIVAADIADITSIPATPVSSLPGLEPEPEPELKPLIAEILRTRYCVPGSVVLVESVDIALTTSTKSRRWRVVRLLLGDGKLCVQALLAPEMHRYVDAGEVAFGSYIRLEKFRVEWLDAAADAAMDTDGDQNGKGKGKERERERGREMNIARDDRMVYLVVENLVSIGRNSTLVEMAKAEDMRTGAGEDVHMEEDEGTPSPRGSSSPSPSRAREERRTATDTITSKPQKKLGEPLQPEHLLEELAEVTETDSDFEVMPASALEKTEQNRAAIGTQTPQHQSRKTPGAATTTPQPQPQPHLRPHRPWFSTDPTRPLKLTSLRAIPHLPYKQNWSVNVLAIVASLTEVEPSGIPPYTQRRARLADPSTAKRVLLTVFLDARAFAPRPGSAVLLLGVKNHRFDGGSLKKYDSDRPRAPGGDAGEGAGDGSGNEARWWFENPDELGWCDVAGLRRWWDEQQQQEQEQ